MIPTHAGLMFADKDGEGGDFALIGVVGVLFVVGNGCAIVESDTHAFRGLVGNRAVGRAAGGDLAVDGEGHGAVALQSSLKFVVFAWDAGSGDGSSRPASRTAAMRAADSGIRKREEKSVPFC